MYSYSELKAATHGFRASNKIGEGGFGSVYKVKKKFCFFFFQLGLKKMEKRDVGFCSFLWIDYFYVLFGGFVVKGRLQDGTFMAVKVLSVELESMRGEREFVSEIAALSDIKHENLVNLRGCCVDGAHRLLVYDYMENNSLSLTLLGNFLVFVVLVLVDPQLVWDWGLVVVVCSCFSLPPTCLELRFSYCCLHLF